MDKKERLVTFRLDQKLYDQLSQDAQKEIRSIGAHVRYIIENYLKK